MLVPDSYEENPMTSEESKIIENLLLELTHKSLFSSFNQSQFLEVLTQLPESVGVQELEGVTVIEADTRKIVFERNDVVHDEQKYVCSVSLPYYFRGAVIRSLVLEIAKLKSGAGLEPLGDVVISVVPYTELDSPMGYGDAILAIGAQSTVVVGSITYTYKEGAETPIFDLAIYKPEAFVALNAAARMRGLRRTVGVGERTAVALEASSVLKGGELSAELASIDQSSRLENQEPAGVGVFSFEPTGAQYPLLSSIDGTVEATVVPIRIRFHVNNPPQANSIRFVQTVRHFRTDNGANENMFGPQTVRRTTASANITGGVAIDRFPGQDSGYYGFDNGNPPTPSPGVTPWKPAMSEGSFLDAASPFLSCSMEFEIAAISIGGSANKLVVGVATLRFENDSQGNVTISSLTHLADASPTFHKAVELWNVQVAGNATAQDGVPAGTMNSPNQLPLGPFDGLV